jgi:hypothetical protein
VTVEADPRARLARLLLNAPPELIAEYEQYLTADERQVIERAIAAEAGAGWRATPLTMGVRFGVLDDLPHTRLLAQKFKDAVEGRSVRQIWNMPPQHGKSIVASRMGPVWALDIDPRVRIGLTSYGDSLARENATYVRDFMVEHADELRAMLRRDRRRADRFVTREGGGIISAGVGGVLTGFGLHGIVVDDPFKNWEDAHSPAMRLRVWNWFRSVALTRLNVRRVGSVDVPGFIIVPMTRWHEEDLSGMLQAQDEAGEGEGWEVVRLPALAEPNDILGRAPGEVLAPSLHSREHITAVMLSLGSYLSSGLYQQRPAPEEGGEIKRAWFQFSSSFPPAYDAELTSWDMKLKDTKTGDFVVGQAWGRTGTTFWCRAMLRGQWNFVETKTAMALMQVRFPSITRHIVENTGNGPEVMRDLRGGHGDDYTISDETRSLLGITAEELPHVTTLMRHGLPGLVPENVKENKQVRMRRHLGILEGGHVVLPEGVDWAQTLLNESAAFPTPGTHDDTVDTMSQALKRLRQALVKYEPPTARRVASPKPGARSRSRTR